MRPLQVFLIANPIIALIAYEYITQRKLPPEEVRIVFTRGQKYPLFDCFNAQLIQKSFINRLSSRLPRVFLSYAESVCKHIESTGREFFMYTSWLDAVASVVVESPRCVGHSYLEEGYMSYNNYPVFPSDVSYNREPKTDKNKINYNYCWRDDATEWIGLSDESFPSAPPERRVVLGGFDSVKKIYKPKLHADDYILLLPTPGRLPPEHWEEALVKLNIYPEKKAYLKLHPGFYEVKNRPSLLSKMLEKPQFSNVLMCDKEIILEAEMIFNHIIIIGDRSSIIRYAHHFGSTFIEVPSLHGEGYGYVLK